MEFRFSSERYYSFCEKHKKNINTGVGWLPLTDENSETCDWVNHNKKRCGKQANWDFYYGQVLD
jgi:hypothetical protein